MIKRILSIFYALLLTFTVSGCYSGYYDSNNLRHDNSDKEKEISREDKIEKVKSDLTPKEIYRKDLDSVYYVHKKLANGAALIEQDFETHDGRKVKCFYSTSYNNGGFGLSCDWGNSTTL